jgi:hypothetical protein
MSQPRTALARRHAAVIASAPEEMRASLRGIAAQACLRRYEQQELGGSDCLDLYLDSEDFYYNLFK